MGTKSKAAEIVAPVAEPVEETKLGIDQVNPVVAFAARTVSDIAFIDEDQDDRIEGNEILSFSWKRSQDAFAVFRGYDWKQFKKELGDLDQGEREVLIETFAKDFKLRKVEAEILIEDTLQWLNYGANLVGRIRKIMKEQPAV